MSLNIYRLLALIFIILLIALGFCLKMDLLFLLSMNSLPLISLSIRPILFSLLFRSWKVSRGWVSFFIGIYVAQSNVNSADTLKDIQFFLRILTKIANINLIEKTTSFLVSKYNFVAQIEEKKEVFHLE